MSPGPDREFAPEEELRMIAAQFEALAEEIQKAIDSLALEPDSGDTIARLERARAAALHGADIARRKLDSM